MDQTNCDVIFCRSWTLSHSFFRCGIISSTNPGQLFDRSVTSFSDSHKVMQFFILSLFQIRSTLTFVFAFFSYSPTLFPGWSSNTSWTKNIEWKCILKTNLTTHVFSAISPSRWPKTSKRICFSMMERSPTVATSAPSQPPVLLSWKGICWFTVERNLSVANSATFPAQQQVTSRDTCLPIQEKSLSLANSVNTPAQQQVASRHTC